MKKTKIFAAVSSALLLSSILMPTALFGQASQQEGSQEITGAETPIFLATPGDFGFAALSSPPTTDTATVHYAGDATDSEHALAVQDLRGLASASFDVTVDVSGTFTDGTNTIPTDGGNTPGGTQGGYYIGLDTTGLTGDAGDATANQIYYDTGAQNTSDGINALAVVKANGDLTVSASDPSTETNYQVIEAIGDAPILLIEMLAADNTVGFSGNVRTGVYDRVVIPAFQPGGTYLLTKVYTLTYS